MPSFNTIGGMQSTAALTDSIALPVVEASPKSGASLYPQLSIDAAAGVLAQLNHTPAIQIHTQGEDVMQEVGPKESYPQSSGSSRSSSPSISKDCEDGVLANAGAAAGQLIGGYEGGPAGEQIGGTVGKDIGGAVCDLVDGIGSPFNTGPDNIYDPTNTGNGGTCTDPGPTGGVSAGTTGGYSISGEDKGGGSSSMASYIDPDTGESITNKDGKTIAGDPNAPSGTYIGEVDDPDFGKVDTGSGPSPDNNGSSSGTNTDNSAHGTDGPSVPEAEQPESTDHPDINPNPSGSLPSDDGSGSDGPINPRADLLNSFESQALPVDDGSGGGTPFSMGAGVSQGSQALPVDDGSGGGTPFSVGAGVSQGSQALPVDDGSGGGTPFTVGANAPQLGPIADLRTIALSRIQIT